MPSEQEGDGYARLRVLFAEGRQSVRIMEQAAAALTEGEVCRPVQYPFGCRAGLGRGAPRRHVPLGEAGRRRADRTLPRDHAVVHELAQLPPRRGEICIPGFSHHSLDIRSVRGRERPMTTKARENAYEPMGHQGHSHRNQDHRVSARRGNAPPALRRDCPVAAISARTRRRSSNDASRTRSIGRTGNLGGQPPLRSLLPLRPWRRAAR